jgi:hypothetical protein
MVRGGEGEVEGWCEGGRVRKGEEGITDYSLCHCVILSFWADSGTGLWHRGIGSVGGDLMGVTGL